MRENCDCFEENAVGPQHLKECKFEMEKEGENSGYAHEVFKTDCINIGLVPCSVQGKSENMVCVTYLNCTFMRYRMYALLEMKKIFIRMRYALDGWNRSKYRVTNTTVYIS